MHWGDEGKVHRDPDAPGGTGDGGPPTRPPPHHGDDGPWYARFLNERGLGALLALVLVGGMLLLGARLVSDIQSFQSTAIAEAARTNEKLEQLQVNHLEQKAQMDRIERMLLTQPGRTP